MVKAIAPKAPIGAARIRVWTSLNTGTVSASKNARTGWPRSPLDASAMPNSTAISNTCRMLPLVKALSSVSGMMSSRKPVKVSSCDFSTNACAAAGSRSATAMFMPSPGFTACATSMPTISAKVEKHRKYTIAFANTRPTARRCVMPAMPVTMVRKITGAMIIFTSLTKPSPSGLSCCANSGVKWPSSAPSAMAINTCT